MLNLEIFLCLLHRIPFILWRYQRTSDEKARLEDHVQSLADKVNEHESKSRTNDVVQKNKEEEAKKHLDR